MLHRLCRSDPPVLVVYEHFVEQVKCILRHASLVALINIAFKWHLFCVHDELGELFGHINSITAHVFIKICSAHGVDDFNQLIVVV